MGGTDESVFASMRSGEVEVRYGSLYHSDRTGLMWTKSLENVHHPHGGSAAIAKVKGIDGIYLANQVLNPKAATSDELTLRSVVSFDDGGKWLPLLPPDKDSEGKEYPCKQADGRGCALHLFFRGNAAGYAPVYSTEKATGLILATGFVGPFAASEEQAETHGVATFLSRDGGWTWREIRKGVHTYEYGDHGAIIVLSKMNVPTPELLYTWDEGSTWETVALSSPTKIENIIIQPNSTSTRFLVIGNPASDDSEAELIVADFAGLHTRVCTGEDKAGKKESDYELWNPRLPLKYFEGSTQGKTDCLMGRKVMYTRRKRLSKCFNGEQRERVEVMKTCLCTKPDYECDVHYFKTEKADCAWDPTPSDETSPEEERFGEDLAKLYAGELTLDKICSAYPGHTTIKVPSGYRKTPGNKCVGGTNLGKQTMTCQAEEEAEEVAMGTETKEEVDAVTGGVKQAKTSSSKMDRQPKELIYLKPDGKVVFTISQYSGALYRSADYGATWTLETGKLAEYNSPDDSVFSAHVSPADPNQVVFVGSKNINWKTTNGGESYESLKQDWSMRKGGIKWHPKDAVKGLAYQDDPNCLVQRAMRCYGNLMLTEDGGRGWKKIAANIKYPNYAWAVEAWPRMGNNAIFAVQHSSDNQGAVSWDPGLKLILSSNFFETQKSLRAGNNFVMMGKYVFVATAKSTSEVGLWVSRGGKFHQAQLPVGLAERGYGLLHTHENSVFLSVRNGDVGTKWGDLLVSDASGTDWVKSLHAVAHESGRPTEIAKVHGTEGVYLANKVINEESASQGSDVKLQSVISFDKGRNWNQLTPPAQDSKGEAYDCEGEGIEVCGLHLFFDGNTMGIPAIYSNDNATGLVWAVGYVGSHITNNRIEMEQKLSTFFSRDAGLTWKELRKGIYNVAFGDHGGIMVAAPEGKATSKILYSWDEGHTFQSIAVARMTVKSIEVFDGMVSQRFIVYGRNAGGKSDGAVVSVDFASLHKRACVGTDDPGEEGSDYELWAPQATSATHCILGHKDQYARRKPKSRCYNTRSYEAKLHHTNCKCTMKDFECESGFDLSSSGKQCVPAKSLDLSIKENELALLYRNRALLQDICLKYPEQEEFVAHSGFRRIPGDTCIGGINKEAVTLQCPEGLSELGEVKSEKLDTQSAVEGTVSAVDEQVKDIAWIGQNKSTVLMVSKSRGTLYRSADEGGTWTRESAKMEGSMDLLSSGESKNGVATIVALPSNPKCAFLVGLGVTHWITRDEGESYETITTDFKIDPQVLPHPTDEQRAIGYHHHMECLKTGLHHCFGDLVLTADGGKTWNVIAERIKYPNYAWSQSGSAILAVQHKKAEKKAKSTRWDPELNLLRTTDDFKNTEIVVPGGNNFAVVGPYVFVAKAESASDVSLWVSKTQGASFTKATFPAQLAQRSYGIMDTSGSGAVFASVRDGDPDVRFSSLYLSDNVGEIWSLSMKHTHHERGFGVDLAKFHGLEGIYMANQVLNADATRQGETPELQTVVTFDAGAEWFPIKGPSMDSRGQAYDCGSAVSCRLHLFFPHNKQGVYGVYAPENAAGLALATGYVGAAGLIDDVRPEEMGLFLTRDAGRTWDEIRRGAYTYEMGDHGAIVLIAKHRQVTNVIHYSWDEGKTWEDIKIPKMEVINIVTDPTTTSQRFIVLGKVPRALRHDEESGGVSLNKARMVHIDLTALHKKKCEGASNAGVPESDYELWSPTPMSGNQGSSDSCQLGSKVVYVRRKRGHRCFNGKEHEGHNETQICDCTHEDYVCAYGYERKGDDCVRQVNFFKNPEEESLAEDLAALYKNRGLQQTVCSKHPAETELKLKPAYSLVPGTKCQGGLQFEESRILCESNMTVEEEVEYHWQYTLFLIALAGVACGVLVLYCKYRAAVGNSASGYAPVSQGGRGAQSGVQVFGEVDPEMDDDFGEDELLAEGVGLADDEGGGDGGWRGMNADQMRHNNRGGAF